MRALVLGGAGFIGSHLVDALIGRGDRVTVVDNLATGRVKFVSPSSEFVNLDIRSKELTFLFSEFRPDVVYHLAAQASVPLSVEQPLADASVNILGSINVLECCVKHGVRRVVYSGSSAMYEEESPLPWSEATPQMPKSPYGVSKLTVLPYLHYYQHVHGLKYGVLVYANVYGPRQSAEGGVIPTFIHRLLDGQSLTIYGDGTQTRDFVYVADVVRANLLAAESTLPAFVVNVGTEEKTSVSQLVQAVERAVGARAAVVYRPERAGDAKHCYLSTRRARELLGWSAGIPLEDGLRHTVGAICREREEEAANGTGTGYRTAHG